MASQPMAMQAFYPHAMGAIASPAGTPSGMVATPAFFGNPALSGTSTAGGTPAGATYTAVWPGGQLMYAAAAAPTAFYQQAIYPTALQMTSSDGTHAGMAIAAPMTAMSSSEMNAAGTALMASSGKPLEGATAVMPAGLPTLALPGAPVASPVSQAIPGQPLSLTTDYWAQAAALQAQGQVHPGTALVTQNLLATAAAAGQPAAPLHGQVDFYHMDEREVKRQRRKQSNRESARRSRLRKQAESEDLSRKVEVLVDENVTRRTQVDRLKLLCEKYSEDNAALQTRLNGASNGPKLAAVER